MLGIRQPLDKCITVTTATIPQSKRLLCCGKWGSLLHVHAPAISSDSLCTLMPIRRRLSRSHCKSGPCWSPSGRWSRNVLNSPRTWLSLSASSGSLVHKLPSILEDALGVEVTESSTNKQHHLSVDRRRFIINVTYWITPHRQTPDRLSPKIIRIFWPSGVTRYPPNVGSFLVPVTNLTSKPAFSNTATLSSVFLEVLTRI